jgi:molybdopterin-guanine dinucleotide biosynthesis protein B
MSKILCFVGKSESGKTTLIEKLIKLAKEDNIKVGAIKHTPEGFSLVNEKKHSGRYRTAGADRAGLVAPDTAVVFMNENVVLNRFLFESFLNLDIIFLEGFSKHVDFPKVLIIEKADEIEHPLPKDIVAVYSEKKLDLHLNVPVMHGGALPAFLSWIKELPHLRLAIHVNGDLVPMNEFVENMLHSLILAMVTPLNLPENNIKTIEIKWRNP